MDGAINHSRPAREESLTGAAAQGRASSGNILRRLFVKAGSAFTTAADSRLDALIRDLAQALRATPNPSGKRADLSGRKGPLADESLRRAAGGRKAEVVKTDLIRQRAQAYVGQMDPQDLPWLAVGIKDARATFRRLDCPHLAALTDALWDNVTARQREISQTD